MGLSVQALTKEYGPQKAVNNISFEAHKGEILGFLGPNGAGKSTTMKIATCYIPPTSGTVELCGYNVMTHPKEVRKKAGYLPEHNPLYLDMYIREYLEFIASLHHIKGKKARTRVDEMIELVGLEREQHKKIGALSKGYRQRVGLAQAIIHEPEVLILDEPTTGLDPNQILDIRKLIKNIAQEKAVIFSTHIMQEVQALCDRVVIINKGNIVANNSVDALKKMQNKNQVVVEFMSDFAESSLNQLEGVERVELINERSYRVFAEEGVDIRADLFNLAVEQKAVLLNLHKEEVTLEQVFKSFTQN